MNDRSLDYILVRSGGQARRAWVASDRSVLPSSRPTELGVSAMSEVSSAGAAKALAELVDVDHLLSDDERAIRAVVREFVGDRVKPYVGTWFETGEMPARELAQELGKLGVLGMHLKGYGCA